MKKSSLDALKTQFDKVYLKHIREDKSALTVAILVKGDKAYVGASKCHEGDNFNREIGRNVSLGRALSLSKDLKKEQSSTRFVLPVAGPEYEVILSSALDMIKEATQAEIKRSQRS